jgi:hypothetical protein
MYIYLNRFLIAWMKFIHVTENKLKNLNVKVLLCALNYKNSFECKTKLGKN